MFKPETLLARLQRPLPGLEAQMRMAMTGRMEGINKADLSKAHKSAVLLLLYQKEGEWHLPLIQRTASEGVHSQQMAFPGGKHDETDDDLVHTALRECWEEVGIMPERKQVLGLLSDLYIPPSNFLVTPVVACMPHPPIFQPNADEVATLFEVPISLLRHPETAKELRVEVRKGVWWNVPGFDIYGQNVWGATAMILSELLYMIEEIGTN